MTIEINNLNYNILKLFIDNSESISEMETDLIIQIGIHILSGCRKKNELLENFERVANKMIEKNRSGKEIDQYKIIRNIINI